MAHDSDPAYVLAAAGTLLALGVLAVGLLFVMRAVHKTKYGFEDFLLLPALLMIIGCSTVIFYGVNIKTIAYPSVKGSPTQVYYNYGTLQKLEMAFFLMHVFGMGCIKLSFVFFYRRIFVTGKPRSKFGIVSLGVIVIIILWTLAFVLLFFTNCGTHLPERFKSLAETNKYCPSGAVSNEGLAIADFITDFMVYALPIPIVIRLHMSRNRKIAVLAVFGIGSLAIVTSIVRLALFVNFVAIATGKKKDPKADEELLVTQGIYWSMLESGIALISCCLPRLNLFATVPSLRSAINSVWSLVQIDSLRSQSSRNRSKRANRSDGNYVRTDDESINAPQPDFVPDKGNSVNFEAYAMKDVENLHGSQKMSNGNIRVDKTVHQQENSV